MKITPPERVLVRYMTRQFWATAMKLAEGIGQDLGWVQSKLRRLEGLGVVECRRDTSKLYRLTVAGDAWKHEHLLGGEWVPATRLPPFNVAGTRARHGVREGVVRYRDTTSKGDCVGIQFRDGSFDWVPVAEAEVPAA